MGKEERNHYTLGRKGEDIAVKYLKKKKYKILTQGFRFLRGEIDIIAYDRDTLVFIEVKTRRNKEYGLPEESVTPKKQNQIKKIALGFLMKYNLENTDCRFDVISLLLDKEKKPSLRHIKDAF
ncbi:MAG: YraN family protein [Elusimicrobiota bacterium]